MNVDTADGLDQYLREQMMPKQLLYGLKYVKRDTPTFGLIDVSDQPAQDNPCWHFMTPKDFVLK